MRVLINGNELEIKEEANLLDTLKALGYDVKFVAIAVNMCCIQKAKLENMQLNEGDKIEVVSPMQGG